jgi:hypothetical protein
MSELRLNLRISSFHKKMMDQQMGVISVEKKETGVISGEMRNVNLEQKNDMTPIRLSGFRNIESLLENPKKVEKERDWYKERNEERPNRLMENKKEEPIEEKFIIKEEDFPTLGNDIKQEKKVGWVTEKKIDINIDNFKKIADDINEVTIKKMNEYSYSRGQIERELVDNEIREQKLEDYIKRVKKMYDRDYVTYVQNDYMDYEMLYYDDEDDMSIDKQLYEEMLEETIYRDVQLENEMYDNESYYKVYDEEAKYYDNMDI